MSGKSMCQSSLEMSPFLMCREELRSGTDVSQVGGRGGKGRQLSPLPSLIRAFNSTVSIANIFSARIYREASMRVPIDGVSTVVFVDQLRFSLRAS
jgi:hypothetical protein